MDLTRSSKFCNEDRMCNLDPFILDIGKSSITPRTAFDERVLYTIQPPDLDDIITFCQKEDKSLDDLRGEEDFNIIILLNSHLVNLPAALDK